MFRILTVLMVFGLAFSAHITYAQDAEPTREELLEQSRNNPPPTEPQNLITGTSHRLFNGLYAQGAGESVLQARAAITDCDETIFKAQIESLKSMVRTFDAGIDIGAVPEATSILFPGVVNRDEDDRDTIERVKAELQAEWDAAQPCDNEEELPEEPVVQQDNESIMDEFEKSSDAPTKDGKTPQNQPEMKMEISQSVALKKLRKMIEDIEKREEKIDSSYREENAAAALSKAFASKGVDYSVRNAEAWGSSIWVIWEGAGTFYDTHEGRLNSSINVVQEQGGAGKAEFKTLERGFSAWQKAEKQISLKLKEVTNLYADLGLIMDKRQALDERSREEKCAGGGNRDVCDPLKEEINAEKEKMYAHKEIIKSKRADLSEHAEQMHFEVLGHGEVIAEEEPEPLHSIVRDKEPAAEEQEPCPPQEEIERAHYRITNAEGYERDAAGFRERAQEMREKAQEWRTLAESPRIRESDDLLHEHHERARGFDLRAEQYERQANEADAAATEERRIYAEQVSPDCDTAQFHSTQIAINEHPPATTPETPQKPIMPDPPEEDAKICGPDITDHVLETLRDLYIQKWKRWTAAQRSEKCSILVSWPEATYAWDISALSPNIAPETQKFRKETDEEYQRYLESKKFWFEDVSPHCAIPRQTCGPTVTFFGECIHSQEVNYVEWGFMNKLCKQSTSPNFWHWLRNTLGSVTDKIHSSQLVMSAVGDAFAREIQEEDEAGRKLPSSRVMEKVKRFVGIEFEVEKNKPKHEAFRNRPEIDCDTTCPLLPSQKFDLDSKHWSGGWGATR